MLTLLALLLQSAYRESQLCCQLTVNAVYLIVFLEIFFVSKPQKKKITIKTHPDNLRNYKQPSTMHSPRHKNLFNRAIMEVLKVLSTEVVPWTCIHRGESVIHHFPRAVKRTARYLQAAVKPSVLASQPLTLLFQEACGCSCWQTLSSVLDVSGGMNSTEVRTAGLLPTFHCRL